MKIHETHGHVWQFPETWGWSTIYNMYINACVEGMGTAGEAEIECYIPRVTMVEEKQIMFQ